MPKRRTFETFAELETQLSPLDRNGGSSTSLTPHTLLLEDIIPAPYQPRHHFDPVKLQELSLSIQRHGLLEPLLVRVHPHIETKYELVAGERRFRACKLAELEEIPVTIREFSDEQAMVLALVENLQREDLNPIEETDAILQLLAMRLRFSQDEVISYLYRMRNSIRQDNVRQNVLANFESIIIQQTFDWLGKLGWESFIITRLPLLNLPDDLLFALRDGKLDQSKAKALSKVLEEDDRAKLLQETIDEDLSLTKLRQRIAALSVEFSAESNDRSRKERIQKRAEKLFQLSKKYKQWKDNDKLSRMEVLFDELESLLM
jgi:ParB family chromosome partitioning protein